MSVVGFIQYVLFDAMVIIGRCNNKSGTSFDDGRARRKDKTRLPVPNFPLSHWSSQLFDLRAPSSTDVPVLLLNQPNNRHLKVTQHSFFFFGGGGYHPTLKLSGIPTFSFIVSLIIEWITYRSIYNIT